MRERSYKINYITRHLTSCYRKRGLNTIGKYLHEPPEFRFKFYEWLISKEDTYIDNWFNKIYNII